MVTNNFSGKEHAQIFLDKRKFDFFLQNNNFVKCTQNLVPILTISRILQ